MNSNTFSALLKNYSQDIGVSTSNIYVCSGAALYTTWSKTVAYLKMNTAQGEGMGG